MYNCIAGHILLLGKKIALRDHVLEEVSLIFKNTLKMGPIKQQSSQTGEMQPMVLVLLREEMSGKRRCGGGVVSWERSLYCGMKYQED